MILETILAFNMDYDPTSGTMTAIIAPRGKGSGK
jgi:hypothetical protein